MDQHDLPSLPDLRDYVVVKQFGSHPSGVSVLLERRIDKRRVFAKRVPCDASEAILFPKWAAAAKPLSTDLSPALLGAGMQDGDFLILRDYIEGESLQDFLSIGGQFFPDDCVTLAGHLAQFLRAVHASGLYHGRLKPSNIIVTASGKPIVTGVHLPYVRPTDFSVTRTGYRIESPAYLSPEHFDPRGCVDIRSDIFSLGAVLYRIATGAEPFPGDTVAEIRDKILHATPKEPSVVTSAIPPAFSRLVMKMLEKAPAQRYQNPDELLADLEGIRRGQDVAARAIPAKVTAGTQAKKPRIDPLLVKLLAILCAVIVIGIVFVFMVRESPVITVSDVRPAASKPASSSRVSPGVLTRAADDPATTALAQALATSKADPVKGVEALERVIRDYPKASATIVQAIQEKARLTTMLSQSSAKGKTELDTSAAALLQRDQYGAALALYTRFATDHRQNKNLVEQAQLASLSVKAQAQKRFSSLKAQAEKHVADKRFEDAARIYELIRDNFGISEYVDAAKQQLVVLEPLAKAERANRQTLQKDAQRAAFLQLILPAEQKARLWQFSQAAKECGRLAADAKENTTLDQLNVQKREYLLLAQLKGRIVEMINSANPRLPLAALKIGKEEGELAGSSDEGIQIAVGNAQVKQRWDFVQPALVESLAIRALRENAADDHAAAGILLLRCGRLASAEQQFAMAEKLGADVSSMRRSAPSQIRNYDDAEKAAEDLISRVQGLMQERNWTDALADLNTLKRDLGRTTYAVQTRSDEIDRWLATCTAGSKLETFGRKLKQGSSIDLLADTAEGQWQAAGGTWNAVEGTGLRCENTEKREAERLALVDYPPQYLFKCSFRVVSGSGILIRVVAVGQTGCDFMVDLENPKNVGLWLSQGGKVTRTVLREVKYERGKWYEFRAAVRPNAITVRCGDAKFTIAGQFPAVPRSALGFVVRQGSVAEFRDAVFQALKPQ